MRPPCHSQPECRALCSCRAPAAPRSPATAAAPAHLHLLLHPVGLGHGQQPVGLAQCTRRVPEHKGWVGQEQELDNWKQEEQERNSLLKHEAGAGTICTGKWQVVAAHQQIQFTNEAGAFALHRSPVVPGAEKMMWDRPAPWGPSTTRARWNKEMVSCRLALLPLNTTSSNWGKEARMAAGAGPGRWEKE